MDHTHSSLIHAGAAPDPDLLADLEGFLASIHDLLNRPFFGGLADDRRAAQARLARQALLQRVRRARRHEGQRGLFNEVDA